MPVAPNNRPSPELYPPNNISLDETTRPGRMRRLSRFRLHGWFPAVIVILLISAVLTGILLMKPTSTETSLLVTLSIDGQASQIKTQAQTVNAFLALQGIQLDTSDVVEPDLSQALQAGMTINITRTRIVSLTVDGTTTLLRTTLDNPDAIVRSAGLILGAADRVFVDGTQASTADLLNWPIPAMTITIARGVELQVVDGDNTHILYTSRATVGEALFDAGILLFLTDRVVPDVNSSVTSGLTVVISRAHPITILVDGTRLETRTTAATVISALAEVNIALNGLDYTVPGEDQPLVTGMTIRVIRVREELLTEQVTLPFETIYQPDAQLLLDTRRVLQAGQEGMQQIDVRVRYENNTEISRTIETDVILREAADQVIAYGTNIVIQTLDTPEATVQYWRRLRVYTTSYHPTALNGSTITATGRILQHGIIGVDPRLIPFDTNLYVEGYGVGIAADTGPARASQYWLDLGYSDADYVHWSRWTIVYLLLPLPENIDYLLLLGTNEQ